MIKTNSFLSYIFPVLEFLKFLMIWELSLLAVSYKNNMCMLYKNDKNLTYCHSLSMKLAVVQRHAMIGSILFINRVVKSVLKEELVAPARHCWYDWFSHDVLQKDLCAMEVIFYCLIGSLWINPQIIGIRSSIALRSWTLFCSDFHSEFSWSVFFVCTYFL